MNLTGIISISGRPGLFKVIAQGKNSVIVESMIDKKRFPAYATEKISTLEDISIFTYEEDVKLTDVLAKMNETFTDNCPAHKPPLGATPWQQGNLQGYKMSNVLLIYFEPNCTSHVQPLDAGIVLDVAYVAACPSFIYE